MRTLSSADSEASASAPLMQTSWGSVVDALRVGVVVYGPKGDLVSFNPRAETLTGYTAQEILGTPFTPFADPEEFHEVCQRALQGSTWEGPVSIQTKAGPPRFLECWASPIADGKSILFILRDTSKEVPGGVIERETLRLDAVGAYIRGIDREVVNILTLGMAAAELLQWRIASDDPLAPCVENLLQACRRGVELNRQASHIAPGTDPATRPIDLTACIRTSLDLVAASLPISIRIQSALTSGVWITASPGVIHSTISSLAHNAAQFLDASGGLLKVTLSEIIDGTERMALITLQSLSESKSVTGPMPGHSMVHAIVEAHGGSLAWTTESDGFTYAVRFPCASVPYHPPLKEGASLQLTGKERIGLVEPDTLLANALRDGMEALGYEVSVFHKAQGALDALWSPTGEHDLWITERDLPDAPDLTWLEELAALSNRPLLIIGGQGTLAHGTVHPCLPKPFSVSDLARNVRRILGSHPAPRELDSPCSEPIAPAEPGIMPRTVLVVEDSRVFRNFLRSNLQQAGYMVIEAQDGAAALETFIQASLTHPVDLLITDIIMPRMDGLELIRQVRRLDHRIPIAVITSMEDQQTAKTALQLGVNDFINKPFSPENLLECVSGMLHSLDDTRKAENTAREVRLAHSTLLATQEKDLPIYSIYEPLSDAGGDIFRCFRLPEGEILFVLADIAGHSVVSSYAVASLLGILSTFVTQFEGLRPLAYGLNQAIQNGPFPDIPACALMGHWTPRTGRLHLLNAGLPHSLVFQCEHDRTQTIQINGTPLGILPEPLMEERVLHLQPGDRVLVASDGFFETCSPEGSYFHTLAPEIWSSLGCNPIQEALNLICEAVRSHGKGALSDDLLVVGFEQALLVPQEDELLAVIPSAPRYIDNICLRLKDYMAACQVSVFSPNKRFEIILAAREALTNAMLHGNGNRKEQRICIHAWLASDGSYFHLRILDEGPGFDLEHHEAAMDPNSERGRGIPIMRHYCSRLTMLGGELTMEFEMEDPRDADS